MSVAALRPHSLAVGGLLAMASAIGIGRFIYTPILPPMVESLGLTQGQAGLIASANFVGYLAGALAAAWLTIVEPRRWLLIALAASAATTGLMGSFDTLMPLLALRFVGGIASAFVLVLASSLVLERLAAAGRGQLAAIHFAGVGTGIAVSSLLTWALDAADFGWRAMWLGGSALSLGALVAVVSLIPASPAAMQASAATSLGGRSGLPRLALAYGLFGFGYIITATFIVAIVRDSALSRSFEPAVWLVVGLTAAPSVAAWVAAGQRFGILPAYALACIAEAAGVVLSVTWQTVAGLFVSSALLGGTFMGLTALGLIAAQDLASDRRRAFALMTSAFGLGQIAGPLVAGYGHDLTGSFFLPSTIAAVGLLIGAGLVLSIRRR